MSEHLTHHSFKDIRIQWNHVMRGLGLLASGAALVACIGPEKPQLQPNEITVPAGVEIKGNKVFLGNFEWVTTKHNGKDYTLMFVGSTKNTCAFDFRETTEGNNSSNTGLRIVNIDNLTVFSDGQNVITANCDREFNNGKISAEINQSE